MNVFIRGDSSCSGNDSILNMNRRYSFHADHETNINLSKAPGELDKSFQKRLNFEDLRHDSEDEAENDSEELTPTTESRSNAHDHQEERFRYKFDAINRFLRGHSSCQLSVPSNLTTQDYMVKYAEHSPRTVEEPHSSPKLVSKPKGASVCTPSYWLTCTYRFFAKERRLNVTVRQTGVHPDIDNAELCASLYIDQENEQHTIILAESKNDMSLRSHEIHFENQRDIKNKKLSVKLYFNGPVKKTNFAEWNIELRDASENENTTCKRFALYDKSQSVESQSDVSDNEDILVDSKEYEAFTSEDYSIDDKLHEDHFWHKLNLKKHFRRKNSKRQLSLPFVLAAPQAQSVKKLSPLARFFGRSHSSPQFQSKPSPAGVVTSSFWLTCTYRFFPKEKRLNVAIRQTGVHPDINNSDLCASLYIDQEKEKQEIILAESNNDLSSRSQEINFGNQRDMTNKILVLKLYLQSGTFKKTSLAEWNIDVGNATENENTACKRFTSNNYV